MGGNRRLKKARCPQCFVHAELCICAVRPRIQNAIPLMLIQGYKESKRPTSTGTLAVTCLSHATRLIYGANPDDHTLRPEPFPVHELERWSDAVFIYPGDGVPELSSLVHEPAYKPQALVFVDGTWPEARRVINRLKLKVRFRQAQLSDAPPTRWGIREETKPGGLATIEAIAHSYRLLGEPQTADALLGYFEHSVRVTRIMRGLESTMDPALLTEVAKI